VNSYGRNAGIRAAAARSGYGHGLIINIIIGGRAGFRGVECFFIFVFFNKATATITWPPGTIAACGTSASSQASFFVRVAWACPCSLEALEVFYTSGASPGYGEKGGKGEQ